MARTRRSAFRACEGMLEGCLRRGGRRRPPPTVPGTHTSPALGRIEQATPKAPTTPNPAQSAPCPALPPLQPGPRRGAVGEAGRGAGEGERVHGRGPHLRVESEEREAAASHLRVEAMPASEAAALASRDPPSAPPQRPLRDAGGDLAFDLAGGAELASRAPGGGRDLALYGPNQLASGILAF